jgi:hypothetical protein
VEPQSREWLRADYKSLLVVGHRHGNLVTIKAPRTDEEFRQAIFCHEIRLHQAFADTPPLARTPRPLHANGHTMLVSCAGNSSLKFRVGG